jgi:hypothetical protein
MKKIEGCRETEFRLANRRLQSCGYRPITIVQSIRHYASVVIASLYRIRTNRICATDSSLSRRTHHDPTRKSEVHAKAHTTDGGDGLDTSTLSRTVERMRAKGSLEIVADAGDARAHAFRITIAGRKQLERAVPAWKQVQKKAADMLGREGVAMLDRLANTLGLSNQPSKQLSFQ